MKILPRNLYELLMYLHDKLRETGVAPSFDEMKEALDLRSKSGIHRLITALEERGFLRRLAHRARALEVVKLPENSNAPTQRSKTVVAKRPQFGVVDSGGSIRSTASRGSGGLRPLVEVPVMGRIAAGTPIEALQNVTDSLPVSQTLIASGEHYALEVSGDSMVNAGILNGDTVIIQRTEDAHSGDIVVALVDSHEATLKRLRKRGSQTFNVQSTPPFFGNGERVVGALPLEEFAKVSDKYLKA